MRSVCPGLNPSQVTALDKLFTYTCLCHWVGLLYTGTSQRAMMTHGCREDNCGVDVALVKLEFHGTDTDTDTDTDNRDAPVV